MDIKATFESKLAAIRTSASDALSQTTDVEDTDPVDTQDAEDTHGTPIASTSPASPAGATGAILQVAASDDAGERAGGKVGGEAEEKAATMKLLAEAEQSDVAAAGQSGAAAAPSLKQGDAAAAASSSASSTLDGPEVASAAQVGRGKLPGDPNQEMGKEGGETKKEARSFMDKLADIEDKLSQTKRLPDANSDLARFRREVPPAPVVVPREHLVIAHGRHLTNPPA